MLTSTLRLFAAALALMSAAPATQLPRKADARRPQAAQRARHRPAHELTDGCRVEPVVAAPAPIAASTKAAPTSCGETPATSSEASR